MWVFKEWWDFFVLRGFCELWSCFWVQGRLWCRGRWSIGVGNRCWGRRRHRVVCRVISAYPEINKGWWGRAGACALLLLLLLIIFT